MAKKPPTFENNQVPEHLCANRSAFTRWFGKSFLRFFGWRVEGSIADAERVLITAAPHTSNWDAVLGLAAVLGLNVRLHFLGKHTIFVPGLKWFMRWLGGIPVNRQNPEGVIDQVNQLVDKHEGIVIVIAPEGTRKKAEKWNRFLRIAEANDCKLQMAALDFPHKRIVLGDLYKPIGDNQADIDNIKQWYSQFKGKFPINLIMNSFIVTVLLSFIIIVIALVLFRYVGVPVYQVRSDNVQAILELAISGQATQSDWDVFIGIPIRQDIELDQIRYECAMLSDDITERQGKLVFSQSSRQKLTELLEQVKAKIEASE